MDKTIWQQHPCLDLIYCMIRFTDLMIFLSLYMGKGRGTWHILTHRQDHFITTICVWIWHQFVNDSLISIKQKKMRSCDNSKCLFSANDSFLLLGHGRNKQDMFLCNVPTAPMLGPACMWRPFPLLALRTCKIPEGPEMAMWMRKLLIRRRFVQ